MGLGPELMLSDQSASSGGISNAEGNKLSL